MMYDFLSDNLLIVCPNSYKIGIISYLNEHKLLLNIKYMTFDEYKRKIKFDYDIRTINYLVKFGLKVDNAITFLKNLYYVEDKEYHNEKLDYLVNLKHELDNNNLLIYDNLFSKMLSKYKVVIYGYGMLDDWTTSLFSNYEIIPFNKKNSHYKILYSPSINEEVEFVFQKIVDLLKNGVDINKISLMNINNEYIPLLNRYSSFYNIPLDIKNDSTLLGTIMGKDFYNMILENKSRDEIFNSLSKYRDNKNYSSLVDILNKYVSFNLYDVHELIKYDLENTLIKNDLYVNVLKIKNVFDYVLDDEYVFLMNFNNESIPKVSLDINYITDNIKNLVGLNTMEEENVLSKKNTLDYLSSINNLIISYKEQTPFETFSPSILLDEMDYELLDYERNFNYSNMANQSLYTMYLDDYIKYGIKNNNLDLLFTNYDKNDYLSYDNKFKGINKNNLIKYLNNELTLSYSSIDNYYKCGFKYYLSNILKIDLYEETFMTIIGNLFHDVLRHMNDLDFDFDKRYQLFLKDKNFTNKEWFFLEKLKSDLKTVIEVIRKHQFITSFKNMLYEKKIDIKLKDSPYVHFKGFVDKIMYYENNNETLVSIIDYKTGNPDIKIKNLTFGLSMQLPIYLYLVNNSDLFSNIKFTGFYLQHILNIDTKRNDKKSIEEQKYDNLKLTGFSSNNLDRLSIFDKTYENSEMIKGLKIKKDGNLSNTANSLSDEEISLILKLTHEKIVNAMNEILSGNFSINPKIINGKNVSCEYCSFKDICYHEEKDNVYLKVEGDDDNAELDEGTE